VRELRKRGARRLEGLVLTHPDLDHIGGAPAVLSSPTVDVVIDPARSSPKRAYVELLELARERRGRLGRLARGRPVDVGWSRLRRARA
jgi:competence protein ComEC